MRKLIYLVVFTTIYSCSNDFQIIEDYKDIPIVYGLISSIDTAQYIRVEKAFVDENTSALELAKIPDSLYYDNAIVKLVRTSNGTEYIMDKIDATNEGYPREDGVFATNPNYLYKINSNNINLAEGEIYKLEIERGDDLPVVSAETVLIEAARPITPGPTTTNINFDYTLNNTYRWRGGVGAAIYDVYLRLNYKESINGGSFENRTILWQVGKNIESDELEIPGINFYNLLLGAMPIGDEYDRRFDNIDFIIDSGGAEILEFNRVGSANLGITSSQDVPVYTNLTEGRGIFSSKHRNEVTNIALAPRTIDSLENGVLARPLNFN